MTVDSIASALVDVFPFIGDIKGLREFFTGEDLYTGESLSGLDRWLGLFLLSEIRGGKKGVDLTLDLLDAAIDALKHTGKLPKGIDTVGDTLKRINAGKKHPHVNDGIVYKNKEGRLKKVPGRS